MKLHELFPEISFNPESSKDIKQWILQLAVEGKLTKKWREENPNINSSDLLKKMNIEKTDLIKSKKIKKETFEALQYNDLIDIPKNWIWLRLGEIGFIFNGDSINATVKEQRYSNIEEGYPYVSTKDVGYGFEDIDLNNGVKIPKDEPKFKLARKNTILICAEGGSAGKKMGIITEESCFGNKLFAIHEFGGISSKFILIFYGSVFFQNEFQSRMSGIIGGISRNKFAEIPICIPPLEEQQAIVSIVEELFKEVNALAQQAIERIELKRSYAQKAMQNLCEANTFEEWQEIVSVFSEIFNDKQTIKTLRETILQLAVQGKLSAKWRNSNTASGTALELLEQSKAEKAQLIKEKKIKAEKPLPAIEADEIPCELPEGWVWCRLGDVISLKSGQDLKPEEYSDFENIGLPYITGASNLQNEKVLINRWTNAPRSIAFKGDLLLTCKGSGVGKMGWLTVDQAHIARQIMALNSKYIEIKMLKLVLDNKASYFKQKANGLIPGIDRGTVLELIIGLAPQSEQQVIVEKVNALLGLCDELEKEVENKKDLLNAMN